MAKPVNIPVAFDFTSNLHPSHLIAFFKYDIDDFKKKDKLYAKNYKMLKKYVVRQEEYVNVFEYAKKLFLFGDYLPSIAVSGIAIDRFVNFIIENSKLPNSIAEIRIFPLKTKILKGSKLITGEQKTHLDRIQTIRNTYIHSKKKKGIDPRKDSAECLNLLIAIMEIELSKKYELDLKSSGMHFILKDKKNKRAET